jgi:GxxExxY protein
MDENELSNRVIGAAIEVHRHLGPGLLESVYEAAMAMELADLNIPFERQKPIVVSYKGRPLEIGFRVDLLVDDKLVVELKAVDMISNIHLAQVLNYVKLTGCKLGLILNFNVSQMRYGVKRVAEKMEESPEPYSPRRIAPPPARN